MSWKKELDGCSDNLREVRNRLLRYKNSLDRYWVATETRMVDDVIDKINRRLNKTADELNDIGNDMINTCQQIMEEERIVREKTEAEARARQETAAAQTRAQMEAKVRAQEEKAQEEARIQVKEETARNTADTIVRAIWRWLGG